MMATTVLEYRNWRKNNENSVRPNPNMHDTFGTTFRRERERERESSFQLQSWRTDVSAAVWTQV